MRCSRCLVIDKSVFYRVATLGICRGSSQRKAFWGKKVVSFTGCDRKSPGAKVAQNKLRRVMGRRSGWEPWQSGQRATENVRAIGGGKASWSIDSAAAEGLRSDAPLHGSEALAAKNRVIRKDHGVARTTLLSPKVV